MNFRVAIYNLGCKVNYYEAVKMQEALIMAGFRIVDFEDRADIYIVNTCTVTNIADRKSRQMLSRAKHNNPKAIVIAAGCYAKIEKDKNIFQKNLNIDLLVDNKEKQNIVDVINKYLKSHLITQNTYDNPDNIINNNFNKDCHLRAFLKIQDGCDRYCSYCLIPFARGNVVSIEQKNIINDIINLTDAGYKEVVLTGIHLSSYGRGFDNEKTALLDLICEISKIEKLKRIRLGSLEQSIITEDFLYSLKYNDKFLPHFHLSLQSGSDTVLKRMNRRYTTDEFFKKCQLLHKFYDMPAITTDIIVGFPQETKEEFNETLKFVEKIKFYEIHVFPFSIRTGTLAAKMKNQVESNLKKERVHELINVAENLRSQYIKANIGKDEEILVEEKVNIKDIFYFKGYSKRYIPLYVECKDTNKDLTNQIIRGKIEGSIMDGAIFKINKDS